MRGHAGYSTTGTDIVCAGVSAIYFALLGFLENSEDAEIKSARTGSGDTDISCAGGAKTEAAVDMALIGLQQIAAKYPDNVQIDIYPR